jgi:hypothetical protein
MPGDKRFLLSASLECLDYFLILHKKQLHSLLKTSVLYYNQTRTHQGVQQRIPGPPALAASPPNRPNHVISISVLVDCIITTKA